MSNIALKKLNREKRHRRSREQISGTTARPRLVVFRSNKAISASLIDDQTGQTLFFVSSRQLDQAKAKKITPIERSTQVGETLAEVAVKGGITTAIFDRSGYRYHGRVKALAEGARQGGLKF